MCSRCELRFYRGRVARFALERQVAGDVFVEQGRRCGQRVGGVAYARQILVRDLDQPTSVLRDVDRLRNDERDQLTDEAHMVRSEDRPLRHARAQAVLAPHHLEKADGLHVTCAHCIVAGEYRVHARVRPSRLEVDRNDAGMCPVGSQEVPIQLTGHGPVGRVFAAARQQAMIFETRDPCACHFEELFPHCFFPGRDSG